ncbi:MAG: HD-GYP domain-containing protein [Phycisphaerales bacterium]
MIPRAITAAPVCAVDPLIERCRAIGVPTWRFDAGGTVVQEPDAAGVLGVWLRSADMVQRIRARVMSWTSQDEPDVEELLPGCWLLPVPEFRRRRRIGFTVGVAFGPEVVEQANFREMCLAAAVDPAVTRRSLLAIARFTRGEAERLLMMLRWSSQDLQAFAKGETAVESLTTQLSDAYETLITLYSIGQQMNTLSEPAGFIEHLLRKTRETLEFGWAGVTLTSPGELRGSGSANPIFVSGNTGCDEASLRDAFATLGERLELGQTDMASPEDGLPESLGAQIISHALRRENKAIGLIAAGSKGGIDPQISSYETLLLEAAAGFLSSFLDNVELYAAQHRTFLGTIKAMTAAIDAKDRYTRGHSDRVARLSAELAREAGLDAAQVERVHLSGLVHDVGKIGVPERVLCKNGRLTPEEFDLIKLHPEIGYKILSQIPALDDLLPGVLHHHERWEGGGYPYGIAGEDIPRMARIICVADTFDAMSSTRSYRPAMPRQRVLDEIRNCAGTQFDPELAECFLRLDLSFYDAMVAEHARDEGDAFSLAA